jgi:GNAT superfamily N-acetyltransferase
VEIRAAAWHDVDAVAELLQVPAEEVIAEWRLPSFHLARDAWVAVRAGRLVGYAALNASQRLFHAADGDEPTDALLARTVARGSERGFAEIHLLGEPDESLLARHPFRLVNEMLEMWRPLDGDLPFVRWPDGVMVRTFDDADGVAVHCLLDEAYGAWYDHYVPQGHEDWIRWMTGDVEFDPSVWWLAERGSELVGCALYWSSGWLKDLAVRESERRHGLGMALVNVGVAEFTRRGAGRIGAKVAADNPTGILQLCERVGFVTEGREGLWALSL